MLSLMGTWMQSVAQGWVVYQMTGSEFALGTISFVGSLPTLFFMLPAGAIADRVPKRTLLVITQTVMMLLAFILAALAATHVLRVWHIAVLAACLGVANSFDAPARQAMAVEMVDDRRDLVNAVALNSTMFNMARIVGPAVGGIVLAALGPTWCFTLNGVSFLAVIFALLAMRFPTFVRTPQSESILAQIKAGLCYIAGHSAIRTMVALVGVSQLFGFWYAVLMPAYAAGVLHAGEAGLGTLQAAVGIGALLGSLIVASVARDHRQGPLLTLGSLLFPSAIILLAVSRSLVFSIVCLALAGVGFVTQNATINTLIQSICPDALRGRVMAVYAFMFFGTTPFAALMAGGVGQALGVRAGVAISAGITLLFTLGVFLTVPALRRMEW
jgi:MFS family permease